MLPVINKILYATDLKEKGAKNAFKMAVSLAKGSCAQLVVVHVIEPTSSSLEGMLRASVTEEELMAFKKKGQEHLQQQLKRRIDIFCEEECAEIGNIFPGGEPIIRVLDGEADEIILRLAKKHDVDLIVMGTRTHTAIGQILLGSTANKVVHHSKVPVMVYPL